MNRPCLYSPVCGSCAAASAAASAAGARGSSSSAYGSIYRSSAAPLRHRMSVVGENISVAMGNSLLRLRAAAADEAAAAASRDTGARACASHRDFPGRHGKVRPRHFASRDLQRAPLPNLLACRHPDLQREARADWMSEVSAF